MRASLSCAFLLGIAIAGLHATEPRIDPPTPAKTAVVRLISVIQGYKPYLAGIEQVKKDDAEAQGVLKKYEEEIQAGGRKAEMLSGRAQLDEAEKIEVAKVKAKLFQERTLRELERRQVLVVRDAFAQIRAMLKEYCQERGILIVYQVSPEREFDAPSMRDMQLLLGLQSTLYHDPGLDVTDAFLAYVNARSDKAGVTPAPPAAPVPAAPQPGLAPTVAPSSQAK